MKKLSVPAVKTFLKAGMNVLVVGKHGTGKSQMLRKAVDELGMSFKYYSASTLDPYTDLVGVPYPIVNERGSRLEMVRPRDIDEAEVIMWDEANRADPKTINAMFEITQFRTINGDPLPKLKSVIVAMNPNDGDYSGTFDLDPAFVDRFDGSFESSPRASLSYLRSVFSDPIAVTLHKWHSERGDKADYLSPRRLEKIGKMWEIDRSYGTLEAAMPPGGVYETRKLFTMLQFAENGGENKEEESPVCLSEVYQMSGSQTVKKAEGIKVLFDGATKEEKDSIISHLVKVNSSGVGGKRLGESFGRLIIENGSDKQLINLKSKWAAQKCVDFVNAAFPNDKNAGEKFLKIRKI